MAARTARAMVAATAVVAATAAIAAGCSVEEATVAGVAYFSRRCTDQVPLVAALRDSIAVGDLSAARDAYIAARPPYEEIETLANVPTVTPLDTKIDARPYALPGGEDAVAWQGFHEVERALYRDNDLGVAFKATVVLMQSVQSLCAVLAEADPSQFTPSRTWDGMLALAYEVPAKKMSSEEEAWSDASMMIFRHNAVGIYSQFAPFKDAGMDAAAATAVDAAYARLVQQYTWADPEHGFNTTDGVARPYSKVPVKPRRLLQARFYDLAAALAAARDTLDGVSEAEAEEGEEGGEPSPLDGDDVYRAETLAGVAGFSRQCALQQAALRNLSHAIAGGDVDVVKAAYTAARPMYEQIETLAGAFEAEDTAIDARPYAFDEGELSPEWAGMHLVERAVYRDGDMAVAAAGTEEVTTVVDTLCAKLASAPSTPGFVTAALTWDGILALAEEVPAKKISSEEETWSDLSLLIFRENAKGIATLYEPFAGRLSAATRAACIGALSAIRSSFEDTIDAGNDWETGLAFRPYSSVPAAERRIIHRQFYRLSRVMQVAKRELEAAASAA
ncbi:hypothetical protein I4F81_009202 [Pyropia yezoensis]|uniref:Uncharacterized protein n=1 Tax=Pyropia yezoensis TaxID=2788 RepID=A0ACC3C8S1_PYRYE|nr:hypothetical protein I4F81_009202 [Neopyropia yezoensis]